MEENDKLEVVDAADEIANLFDELGKYDRRIFDLSGEIRKADEFIEEISVSEADRIGLEQSMGIDVVRTELEKHRSERDRIAQDIEKLQESTLGKEIPRNENGEYEVPWDKIQLIQAQAQVNIVFRGTK